MSTTFTARVKHGQSGPALEVPMEISSTIHQFMALLSSLLGLGSTQGLILIQGRTTLSGRPTLTFEAAGFRSGLTYDFSLVNPSDIVSRMHTRPAPTPAAQARPATTALEENLRQAYEHYPELLIQEPTATSMLYLRLRINGSPLIGMVDTGAQMSVISHRLAKRVGLEPIIDRRMQGTVIGAGSAKIIGKIHLVQLQVDSVFLPCSLMVVESELDLLLGIDMLRRHRAVILVGENTIRLGGSAIPFLSHAEAREETKPEDKT
eukprot:gnl/Dysnectes_brevis/11303_a23662_99.p2 GENE.gnl/Dysnectes_brevis/11303_a23662_99~~gnl/Dysnectes_brevis/11303_a23662_99.p2  ORF type:complete len:263 (+),score=100.19 gnl/Dysnectes_brevis/11303_a23662_99:21-809(+)